MQLSAPPDSSFTAMSESTSASTSTSASSVLPTAGDAAKEPSTLKPLFKHIRRMICLRNVGRPGFVPRDLNRQDRILEAMSTTLREYGLEIERLTKEIHAKQALRRTTHSHSHSHSHSSVKTRLNKLTPAVTATTAAASLDPRLVHRATVVSQSQSGSGASSALSLSLAPPTKDVSLVSSRPPFLPLASSSSSTSLLSHPQDPSPSSSSSTTAPVPAPSPSDSSSVSNLSLGLPPLNHTFSRLFLDSDIPRAIFSPSLRVLESNERFVMSPVFNAISRADLMGRRLSVYAFYDPACADDLLGSTTQLQRGETLELLLVLTSTRPMAPALQLRVVAYPSYKPSVSGSSPSHHTRSRSEVPVVEHFHLVVTHCEKVQTPPHLQAPTQFLHHPGVEYIVRSSQTRVAMRPDTLSSPPNPTIHTTVSSSMLLSSHSTVVSSHISTPLAFVPQQQNPNILPLLPLPPAVAPAHSFFTTISSTTHNHNHNHRTPLALERASSFDSAYKSRSVDISLSPALWAAAAPSSSTARALAGAGPTKEQSSMFATALSSGAVSSMMSPSSQSVAPPPPPPTSTSTVDWSRFFSESHPSASTSDMGMGVGDYPFPFSPTPAEAAGDMHHMFPPGASSSLFSPLYNPILPTPSTAAGPAPSSSSWLPGTESATVGEMHVGVDTAPSATASSSDVVALPLPLSRFSSSASLSAPSSEPATALSVAASSSSAISDLLKSHGVSTGSQLFDLLLSSHNTALEMDESEFRAFVSSSTLAVL